MKTIHFKTSRRSSRFFILSLSLIGIVALVTLFGFMNKEEAKETAPQLMAVNVSNPLFEEITEWDEYTGRFEASNKVEIRARVSGYIDKVNFEDGQMVNKGDILFVIDQRPFRIALSQARATYNQQYANLKQAEDNFARVETLKSSGAVSVEEYGRRQQALAGAKASLQLAKARVDEARLNLDFTKVKAPIAGRVSRDLVNEGNLIDGGNSNATMLTTIVSTSPIHFYFTGSEADYLKYVRMDQKGERSSSRTAANPVFIKLQDEEDFVHEAKMNFVDNQIDQRTGTIEARAILDNKDGLFEPGMFGKARLLGSAPHNAIMIPDNIIATNQSVRYVYVLDENDTVQTRNVTLGPLHTNGLRIVRDGLQDTDRLVLNNIQKIRPSVVVDPTLVAIITDDSPITTELASN
ncbi:efflux RND transporter periplasmic adaptor subunit [Aquimarina sp. U1-2]|uniref:efflux RND transporter periplasmic adaptor subunit n=1 Tax=Aquimarina sp. U1-2 TaxID=2823141 RepID=UPI001AECB59A|nr:efflux RND transporter periplasmic adaptor subunit [Aquimarina sp. U1-2]MBP2831038.1 efflux RND transporter periplasmic adaptor subunit [Aquimarina sp. U1-2]